MKRICIFTAFTLPHLGGVERYTDKLVKALKKNKDIEITIITCNLEDNDSYKSSYNGCDLYKVPTYKLFRNRYPLIRKNGIYKKVIKEISTIEFDAYVCQTRFYFLTQVGAELAEKKRKKPIIIEHGSSHLSIGNKILDYFGEKLEHYLTFKLKKRNPLFYGVSERCNEWLKHFKINASGVLYNSVDSEGLSITGDNVIKEQNEIIFSYVGRIIEEKGVRLLLESFNKLDKEYDNISLYIAGDGSLLSELKSKYKSKNIHFVGQLGYSDVFELLKESDVFVHPSMYPEGLPTAILEAGINRNAIIATDRGGTVEVINNGKIGIIVEENVEAVYEAMKYLLDNKGEIEKFKNAAFERVNNNFTWDITAKKLIEVISDEDN